MSTRQHKSSWPWVRDVSEALRPSLKLTSEWLWAPCPPVLSGWRVGSGGFMPRKTGAVWLTGAVLNASFRAGFSSGKLKSLWVEPMLYSESMLPRDGFRPAERSFCCNWSSLKNMDVTVFIQCPKTNTKTHMEVKTELGEYINLINRDISELQHYAWFTLQSKTLIQDLLNIFSEFSEYAPCRTD